MVWTIDKLRHPNKGYRMGGSQKLTQYDRRVRGLAKDDE